jgi:hypothetical protein
MNTEQEAQFEAAINAHINAAVAAAMAARLPPPPQQQAAAVSAVAVKLPEFWTSDLIMWFRQAEACFRRSNITISSTMYDHVLMKLPEVVVISVRSLINEIQPGANDLYKRLKERLTVRKNQVAAGIHLDQTPAPKCPPPLCTDGRDVGSPANRGAQQSHYLSGTFPAAAAHLDEGSLGRRR